jgi:ATP-dependent protease ClpP protease subunit
MPFLVSGTVATGTGERRAAPHARFSLRLDAPQSIHGTALDITRHADELSQQRSRYLTALAAATGHPEGVLAEATDRGRANTADEALAMGIVDTIAGRP